MIAKARLDGHTGELNESGSGVKDLFELLAKPIKGPE